jgi:hypothetical protein
MVGCKHFFGLNYQNYDINFKLEQKKKSKFKNMPFSNFQISVAILLHCDRGRQGLRKVGKDNKRVVLKELQHYKMASMAAR